MPDELVKMEVSMSHAKPKRIRRPNGTLRIDWEAGEGDVRLPPAFFERDPLFRADVIGDWIEILQFEYEKATGEYYEIGSNDGASLDRYQKYCREIEREVIDDKDNGGPPAASPGSTVVLFKKPE